MKIVVNDIFNLVEEAVFYKGIGYYRGNRVVLTKVEPNEFYAYVIGLEKFQVYVTYKNTEYITRCTCSHWDVCKHVVAAMLTAKDYYDQNRNESTWLQKTPRWQSFFEKFLAGEPKSYPLHDPKINYQIIYTIELSEYVWMLTPQKLHIKKDGLPGRMISISSLSNQSPNIAYAPNDPVIIQYLQSIISNTYWSSRDTSPYRNNPFSFNKKIIQYGAKIGIVLSLMKESIIYQAIKNELIRPIQISDEPGKLEFRLLEQSEGFTIQPYLIWRDQDQAINNQYYVLSADPIWLLWNDTLIKLENNLNSRFIISYLKEPIPLKIAPKELPQFINRFLNRLNDYGSFQLPARFPVQQASHIDGKRLYLNEGERHLLVTVKVLYQQVELDLRSHEDEIHFMEPQSSAIVKIKRDFATEKLIIDRLLESGLKITKEGMLRIIDSRALAWIFEQIPVLVKEGFEIFGNEKLSKYKYNSAQPRIYFSVSSNIDWFDLHVEIDFEGIQLSIRELKRALQKKSRYVKLVDGSLGILPEDWFRKFEHLFNFGKVEEQRVRLSKFHLTLIDLLFEQADTITADDQVNDRLKRLKGFAQITSKGLPQNFNGTLRDYQSAGFDWLYFLQEFTFGGCLADDMGLGKTIQALALLQNEKNNGIRQPSLIVCPTSVVYNWENEIKKFTPDLKVLNQTGIDREKNPASFDNYDVILTSYGILIRDIAMLIKYHFHYIIVDESQKMKNPVSLTARSARLLKSNHRLALTGTPVENNTLELWSLFAFLNPGLLGTSNYFKRVFTAQIEKKQNEQVAEQLRRLIFPFILRRTKDQVARELPPKTEQISYCHMNERQQALYQHWRNYYRLEILSQVDQQGLNRSKMKILEGLTRLRLIACHPQLIDKEITEHSGKFELLQDVLEDIVSENHKVLVFSQFVKMLTLIRRYLDEQGIPYEYLDGRTRDRESCINHFQTDAQIKIFLISLKAGGTGLNLTAADYVLHYDPWWNPAVELQATDRTHRIGQDKKVFVYKFITRASIEEKMLQLQDRKKSLVSQIITTDVNFFKTLTREDVEALFS